MPKKEAPLTRLQDFLPPGTLEPVLDYLQRFQVHLTIARDRKSILGDYRHRTGQQHHRISVNGSLNRYSFLITLLHEIAHLITFEAHGNKVAAHGKEWKAFFGQLLAQFIRQEVFPQPIREALLRSLHNPAASSCADEHLLRTLKQYDERPSGMLLVEELEEGALFRIHDGRVFRKGQKLRKRYRCEEVATRRLYLFSGVYEVERAGQ
jgi:SprT protein